MCRGRRATQAAEVRLCGTHQGALIVERDLQVHTDDFGFLSAELRYVVDFFRELGHEQCHLFFGWSWLAKSDKPDLMMKSMIVSVLAIEAEIRGAEDAGLGNFGRDDIWVSIEGHALEFQFCHHGGIHLFQPERNDITRHFLARWRGAGLSPKEFEKASDSEWLPT